MKKNYLYAAVLVIMSLLLGLGCFLYMEYRPSEYENGIFVELPEEIGETRNLAA